MGVGVGGFFWMLSVHVISPRRGRAGPFCRGWAGPLLPTVVANLADSCHASDPPHFPHPQAPSRGTWSIARLSETRAHMAPAPSHKPVDGPAGPPPPPLAGHGADTAQPGDEEVVVVVAADTGAQVGSVPSQPPIAQVSTSPPLFPPPPGPCLPSTPPHG